MIMLFQGPKMMTQLPNMPQPMKIKVKFNKTAAIHKKLKNKRKKKKKLSQKHKKSNRKNKKSYMRTTMFK